MRTASRTRYFDVEPVDAARVILVGDRFLILDALRVALKGDGIDVAVTAPDRTAVEGALRALDPGMVILDVSRTPIDVALRSVRNLQSEVSTLLCIAQEGVSVEASRLVGAGAAAVLGLDTALPEVVAAVRSVLNGRAPMSLERRYRLEQILREHLADEQRRWLPFGELTERERTIFALVYDGMSADQIAERECVSVHTVRSHIRQILAKLNVNSQLAAVALARSHGWFAPVAGA